jgi:hypothetical protein
MQAPSPSVSHHTPCSALVNAALVNAALVNVALVRARADSTIVPEMATPRAVPVCRPAEASDVASPAIERGIPDTAVLVTGGLTVPRKTPNSDDHAGAADREDQEPAAARRLRPVLRGVALAWRGISRH